MFVSLWVVGTFVLLFVILFASVCIMVHKLGDLKEIVSKLEGEEKEVDDSKWGDSEGV